MIPPKARTPLRKTPILPKRLPLREMPLDEKLLDHEHYTRYTLTQNDFSGQQVESITLEESLCQQVSFRQTQCSRPELLDLRCNGCDFANAEWTTAHLQRVELLSCQLTGWRCIESRLQDLLFKDCLAQFSQFRFATFTAVQFENCDLSGADFQGANLSGVRFSNCNLSDVEFSGAKLQGADLRGSRIDGLRVGAKELQGATVDPSQAIALMQAFGVIVE